MSARCFVCGREFENGDKIVSVTRSKYSTESKAEGKSWGNAHDDCFDRAVDVPAVVMERVKKLAAKSKAAAKKSAA